jgi:hypothetical protein
MTRGRKPITGRYETREELERMEGGRTMRSSVPPEPSRAAIWRMLEEDYGVKAPTIKEKIRGGDTIAVGDFDQARNAFPIWISGGGTLAPAQYWFEPKRGRCNAFNGAGKPQGASR